MANYSDIKYQPAGSATTTYSDMAALIAATGMSAGDQALVTALNKVFMYTGSAWYLVAIMTNDSPTAITGVDGTYSLATDGTATTVTAVSSDPEGFPLTWSYAVTTGSLGSTATVSQADNVFTITPSTTEADAGSFSITFSVTDGATGAVSAVSAFTLAFIVTNSRYTALSVKATNTGSNQTFDDASASNHTITVVGNSTTSTFSPHRHGGYSTYLGTQTSRYYSPSSSDFDIGGTGNWSYEAWVYADNQTFPSYTRGFGLGPFYNDPKSFGVQLSDANNSNNITVYWDDAAGLGRKLISSTAFSQEVWHHLLVCRSGNDIALFLDGTRIAHDSSYTSSIDSGNTYLFVGSTGYGTEGFMGYVRDVRFINGSHPYDASASSITVPTEPLTVTTNTKFLLGDLPYFKDQSASNHAITVTGNVSLKPKSVFDNSPYSEASHGASAYFDGTGDYLDVGSSGIANFGIGDFTIEFWINSTDANALASGASNIINPISSTGSGYWGLMFQNGKLRWNNSYNVANLWEVNASTILNGSFNHIAVVRNSGAFSIYFNGVAQSAASGTFTDTTNYSGDTGVRIGSGNANDFVGTLSDLRIVSSAVYTANFTPPTAPLTAVTNTKFLLNPETSISDLSQRNAIKCVGDAATSTTQVKFAGTKSIAFDGTGDYLQTTLSDKILTSQFTVEGWVRMSTVGGPEGVFHLGASAFPSNIDGLGIFTRSSTYSYNWGFFCNGTQVNSSTAPSAGVWYHLALVRDSNNLVTMYLDGNSLVTSTQSGSIAGDILTIGGYYNSSYIWNGNIQDFRITKGLARYTSNFTPPTAELEG